MSIQKRIQMMSIMIIFYEIKVGKSRANADLHYITLEEELDQRWVIPLTFLKKWHLLIKLSAFLSCAPQM